MEGRKDMVKEEILKKNFFALICELELSSAHFLGEEKKPLSPATSAASMEEEALFLHKTNSESRKRAPLPSLYPLFQQNKQSVNINARRKNLWL